MNAKDARIKYFELFVTFEHYIRRCAAKLSIVTKNKNFQFPSLMISSKILRRMKDRRNWLAHQHGNAQVNALLENDFKEIDDINRKLLDWYENILKE